MTDGAKRKIEVIKIRDEYTEIKQSGSNKDLIRTRINRRIENDVRRYKNLYIATRDRKYLKNILICLQYYKPRNAREHSAKYDCRMFTILTLQLARLGFK